MENLTKIIIIVSLLLLGFNGCSSKSLDAYSVDKDGNKYNGLVNKTESSIGTYIMAGININVNRDENIALIIKAAALQMKKDGAEYFSIEQTGLKSKKSFNVGISPLVTNTKDLIDYCFPNAYGLENKCELLEQEKIVLNFKEEKKSYFKPLWSVEQVLNDKSITKIEVNIKELTLKEIYNF